MAILGLLAKMSELKTRQSICLSGLARLQTSDGLFDARFSFSSEVCDD